MSSERASNSNNRPTKSSPPPTRPLHAHLTPRIATVTTPSVRSTHAASTGTSAARSIGPRATVRVKNEDLTTAVALGNTNITPRSLSRKLRGENGQLTPTQQDNMLIPRPKTHTGSSQTHVPSQGIAVGTTGSSKIHSGRPRSVVGDGNPPRDKTQPIIRSPGLQNLGQAPTNEDADSRFFHASDMLRQDTVARKIEPKRSPAAFFYYADGQKESPQASIGGTTSLPLGTNDQRYPFSLHRSENTPIALKSPPILSPALSSLSSTSLFFTTSASHSNDLRPPSPSKENIHLSYRKGASQIFGMRPTPRTVQSASDLALTPSLDARPHDPNSLGTVLVQHRKSPSDSSIDSGNSHLSRRRSATTTDVAPISSPLTNEIRANPTFSYNQGSAEIGLLSIDTNGPADYHSSPPERALSPSKGTSEVAADARRERKVLDLEISNSSLLAINASLERELRRQKAELKRFRRLSRAGRFSLNLGEASAEHPDGHTPCGGDSRMSDDEATEFALGPFRNSEDQSEDDSDSATSEEMLSSDTHEHRENNRLDKDERRLQFDLARHKEMLVQSQSMNESLRRCMYATEDMIREGKKALEYHIHVSDIRLGGRVLTCPEENEDEDISDAMTLSDLNGVHDNALESAHQVLQVWQDVSRPALDVKNLGDSDSGFGSTLDVDRSPDISAKQHLDGLAIHASVDNQ